MTSSTRQAGVFRVVVALVTVGTLSSCATDPIVSWTRPAPTLVTSVGLRMQDDARAVADAARDAYRQAIATQSDESRQLGNVLIVGGALAAVLALGQAHRDAIQGTALLGGALYALGTFNTDRRRWLMYQAGIEAFNCAKRAAAPADMTEDDFAMLKSALSMLEVSHVEAQIALAGADAQVGDFANSNASSFKAAKPLVARIKAARAVIDAGSQILAPGYNLQQVVGATPRRLEQMVDTIDDAVRKALIGSLSDFTQVPALIGGLGISAAAVAPGAGIDKTVQTSLSKYDAIKLQSAVEPQPVPPVANEAMKALEAKLGDVARHSAVVRGFLGAHAEALKQDMLAGCSVGDLSYPLSLKPTSLQASSTDGPQFVLIEGGKPPYQALVGGGTTALVVRGPARNDAHFEVESVTSAVTGKTYNVLVLDSSSPSKSAILPVQIDGSTAGSKVVSSTTQTSSGEDKTASGAAPAAASGPATGAGTAVTVSDTRSEVQKAVDNMPPFEMPDKSKVALGNATAQAVDGRLTITLSCVRPATPKPPQPACFPANELRARVLQAVGAPLTQSLVDGATLKQRGTLCICP